jgi:hypothetical protein
VELDLDAMLAGDGDIPKGYALVLVAPAGHGAGPGRDNGDYPRYALVPERDVRSVTSTAGELVTKSYAVGGSMEPWIADGDRIEYIPAFDLVEGARYALWLDGGNEDVVKRIRTRGDGWIELAADNPLVPSLMVKPSEATGDDPEGDLFETSDGRTLRVVVRGRVVFPPDRHAAVFAQLAEFARSIVRPS